MYTELAPMASLIQRFGRFNRTGEITACDENHCIYWVDVPDTAAAPYEKEQLSTARVWLDSHADASPAALEGVPLDAPHGDVVRRRDLLGTHVWYLLDPLTGAWNRETNERRVYPGMEILLSSDQGGYNPVTGWDPSSTMEVDVTAPNAQRPDSQNSNASSVSSTWLSLGEHTGDVEAEETAILASLNGAIPVDTGHSVMRAARLHDWGKAYPAFQNLIATDPAHSGTIWAKAPPDRWTRGRGPVMRHELASGLAALERGESFLVAYLAAAHHGKIRGSIRSLPGEHVEKGSVRRIRGGVDGA